MVDSNVSRDLNHAPFTTYNQNQTVDISHRDLIQLSTFPIYHETIQNGDLIHLHESKYRIVDIYKDNQFGFNAITVFLEDTNLYVVIFQDSKVPENLFTMIQLHSDILPGQFKAAQLYFEKIQREFGSITYLTGNSIGGSLAIYIGLNYPEVDVVTLNPSLLPEYMFQSDKTNKNIINYFSNFDSTMTAIETGSIAQHIPGKNYKINYGLPLANVILNNQTEIMSEKDKDSNWKYEGDENYLIIGEKDGPGYGKIYLNPASHIMTSLFTGEILHGGLSNQIIINYSELMRLSAAMESEVIGRMERVIEYINHSLDITAHENNQFLARIQALQDSFESLFKMTISDPVFSSLIQTPEFVKGQIDGITAELDIVKESNKLLQDLLNSPPVELADYLPKTDNRLDEIFNEIERDLNLLKYSFDDLSAELNFLKFEVLPNLFASRTHQFKDAVVEEILAHYSILMLNKERILQQIIDYKLQIVDVAEAFKRSDEKVEDIILSKQEVHTDTKPIHKVSALPLEESPYLMNRLLIKEEHVSFAFHNWLEIANNTIRPLLSNMSLSLAMLESLFDTLSNEIKMSVKVTVLSNIPTDAIQIFSNYDEQVSQALQDVLHQLNDVIEQLAGFREGVRKMILYFPDVVNQLRHYLNDLIFDNDSFENIHLYHSAAKAICDDLKLLFNDMIHQFSSQQSKSIQELEEIAKIILKNILIFEEQIHRLTLD